MIWWKIPLLVDWSNERLGSELKRSFEIAESLRAQRNDVFLLLLHLTSKWICWSVFPVTWALREVLIWKPTKTRLWGKNREKETWCWFLRLGKQFWEMVQPTLQVFRLKIIENVSIATLKLSWQHKLIRLGIFESLLKSILLLYWALKLLMCTS